MTTTQPIPSPNALVSGPSRSLSVRLPANEYATLAALAERRGCTPARLAETWIYLSLVDATEGEQ